MMEQQCKKVNKIKMQTFAQHAYTQLNYKPTRRISLKNENLKRQKINQTVWGIKANLQQKNPKTTIDLKKFEKRKHQKKGEGDA